MEDNKPNSREIIMITSIICTLILVGFIGSYAFFINSVENNENQEVTVQTGTMQLIFSDGNNGFNKELDFGENAEKTFTIENTGTKEGTVSVSWMNLLNTYLEGTLTYSFLESDTEGGEYTEIVSNKNVPVSEVAEDWVLASGITISAGVKKYYKLIITLNSTDFDQTADLQAKLETQFKITEGELKDPTPGEKTLAKLGKTVKEGNPNFAESAITDETKDGLYAMEDDYGTSYYYRGAVEDNYVKFAGFYWRIMRVNGDGSIRIAYDGTKAHANNDVDTDRIIINDRYWNSYYNDAKYVGYMFGGAQGVASTSKKEAQTNETSPDTKIAIDNWYFENIESTNWKKYVSDNLFCDDRSTASEPNVWSIKNNDTALGYGINHTYYGPTSRFVTPDDFVKTEVNPTIKCLQQNDRFTVDDMTIGNGSLTYPIGLMSIDEVNIAGSGIQGIANNKYYLYKGYSYWTMSSGAFHHNLATRYYVDTTGAIFSQVSMNHKISFVPVINLSVDAIKNLIGTGTMTDPYRLLNETI